jgi:hypothetical protein
MNTVGRHQESDSKTPSPDLLILAAQFQQEGKPVPKPSLETVVFTAEETKRYKETFGKGPWYPTTPPTLFTNTEQ